MIWMSRIRKTITSNSNQPGKSGRFGGVKRSRALWSLGAQMGLLVVALVFSVASGSKGDRATTGVCPEGEVCSPDTPDGLYFKGPGFADGFLNNDVHPTAVGGQQTIDIDPVGLFHDLSSFDAETTDPALAVTRVDPPEVVISGVSVGSAYLRIFEPLTGALYDRLTVMTAEVDTIEVEPAVYESSFEDDDLHAPLYWGDAPLPWIARLHSSSNTRLVDENLTFADATASGALVTQGYTWDLAEVTPTSGVNAVSVSATSGSGVVGEGSADLAHDVDFILLDPNTPVPETHDASEPLTLCFAAYFGERRILGVPWEVTVTGPNGEEPVYAIPGLFERNCVTVVAGTAGVWQLDVTADPITESYDITIVQPQPAPPPPPSLPAATPAKIPQPASPKLIGTPGWRARGGEGT
jgi:hypothetical protein